MSLSSSLIIHLLKSQLLLSSNRGKSNASVSFQDSKPSLTFINMALKIVKA
jgi:hypothetical protein